MANGKHKKRITSIRLSQQGRANLERLAELAILSMNEAVELAVRESLAKRGW